MPGWIGVDLDGTLAEYHGWVHELHIGDPIPKMVERVKTWLSEGKEVKIVTARISSGDGDKSLATMVEISAMIKLWCKQHIGQPLEVVCCKDFSMIELWDDRCKQVVPNTGLTIEEYLTDQIRSAPAPR